MGKETTANRSFMDRAVSPVFQAVMTLGGIIIVSVIAKLIGWTGLFDISQRFPWLTAASFMLCFSLFNSVFLLSSKNTGRYWGRSLYSFMGLAVTGGLVAWGISSLSIFDAGSYSWIYIVLSVAYLVFLSMMTFMRNIVEFAEREEWHHPRMRRRKGKKGPYGDNRSKGPSSNSS